MRGNAIVRRLGVRLQASDVAATIWHVANTRRRRRVHWYVGMQARLMALANKYVPDFLNRAGSASLSVHEVCPQAEQYINGAWNKERDGL
jgi:hypothetical protein